MKILENQIRQTLLPGMYIPKPLELLFDWIEENGLYTDNENGYRIGVLFPEDELKQGWTDIEKPGGTDIGFFGEGNINLKYWFGHDNPDVINRLCVFANTGADGSMAAFWLNPDGEQKIVHLGSGSGSTLVCVLADDPVNFLRLLAIGYDEICWNDDFSNPPNAGLSQGDVFVKPNDSYRKWVEETFSVEIPKTALEIVKHPSEIGDTDSKDQFCNWVTEHTR